MELKVNREAPVTPPITGVTLALSLDEWYTLRTLICDVRNYAMVRYPGAYTERDHRLASSIIAQSVY